MVIKSTKQTRLFVAQEKANEPVLIAHQLLILDSQRLLVSGMGLSTEFVHIYIYILPPFEIDRSKGQTQYADRITQVEKNPGLR
jgi:hypothetical protein